MIDSGTSYKISEYQKCIYCFIETNETEEKEIIPIVPDYSRLIKEAKTELQIYSTRCCLVLDTVLPLCFNIEYYQ